MVIDDENLEIVTEQLIISGRLRVDISKVKNLHITTKLIFIAPGGEFIVGTSSTPFLGNL